MPAHFGTACGRLAAITLLILATVQRAADAAQKTDVVELKNGDRITCEIKKLDRGKLTVKTDGIGTLSIEWDDVARVTSTTIYDVELVDGSRVYGALERADAGGVDVAGAMGQTHLLLADVVRVTPLGGTFWRRLDGSMNGGFSFTEANVQTQWTFNADVSYRSRYWLSELSGDSSLTTQEDAERQTRNTLTLRTQRFLRPRWSALGFVQFQQNEELSLDLRSVLGGGIGRVLAQSNRTLVELLGGVAFTREEYAGADDVKVAEVVGGVNLEWFTFDGRSTSLDTAAISYYALNLDNRLRLELDTSFRSDIVGDLYWSINLFNSFNSAPPPDEKRNDFGVSATIGWSF
jgi:hypothetical protein